MLKRFFDFIVSLIGIIILSPLFLLFGILIKTTSFGPIFYKGVRVGLAGKIFKIYKFRTMVADAEQKGGSNTSNKDPRINKVGTFLRKYKLDELSQLINVLKGEMSLVGPRPEVPYYVNLFSNEEKTILTVKPGITDWASIWDYDEGKILAKYEDVDMAYETIIRPKKLKLQLEYVKKHSFITDLKIIFFTLVAFFYRKSIKINIQ